MGEECCDLLHEGSTDFGGQGGDVAETTQLLHPDSGADLSCPVELFGEHLPEDSGGGDVRPPVQIAVGTIGNGAELFDGVPVAVIPLLAVCPRVVPPRRPSASISQHSGHLVASVGRVQPVPRLSECDEIGATGGEGQDGRIGNDRPHARPSPNSPCKHLGPIVDRDDGGTGVLELSGSDPRARPTFDHDLTTQGTYRFEQPSRVPGSPVLIVIDDLIEQRHANQRRRPMPQTPRPLSRPLSYELSRDVLRGQSAFTFAFTLVASYLRGIGR